jgi:hypothetical protein
MSFDPLSAALELGASVINKIWPDPVKQAEEQRKLQELFQKGDIAELNAHVKLLTGQIEVNKIEASSSNWFVAGWRPFVGWVCGFGLAYATILEPFMRFIAKLCDYAGTFPVIDTTLTMQILLGMLGLAGMRTREKEKGVTSQHKVGK